MAFAIGTVLSKSYGGREFGSGVVSRSRCRNQHFICFNLQVVGVIGRGHFRGVLYAMRGGSDSTGIGSGLRFSDLVDGKNSTAGKQRAKRELVVKIVLETALAAALFLAWDMYTDTDGSGVMAGLMKM